MPHLLKAFEISNAIAHVINSLLSASPILSVMTGHQQWNSRSIYCLSLTKFFLLSWSTTFLFMIDVNFSDETMQADALILTRVRTALPTFLKTEQTDDAITFTVWKTFLLQTASKHFCYDWRQLWAYPLKKNNRKFIGISSLRKVKSFAVSVNFSCFGSDSGKREVSMFIGVTNKVRRNDLNLIR